MARPTKHNVDYFSHDADMRNDLKIKALRRKFGHTGYSIWNMLLEHLADCEYFEYGWHDENIELLSADFDIDTEDIKDIVNYCIKLGLLQLYQDFLTCDKLTDRLEETVLVKRKDYSRNNSIRLKLFKVNSVITQQNGVNDGNNGQSKVKESKEQESTGKDTKLHDTKVECSKVNESEYNSDTITDEPSLGGDGSNSVDSSDELKQLVLNGLNN
jgi:hypothetical protein